MDCYDQNDLSIASCVFFFKLVVILPLWCRQITSKCLFRKRKVTEDAGCIQWTSLTNIQYSFMFKTISQGDLKYICLYSICFMLWVTEKLKASPRQIRDLDPDSCFSSRGGSTSLHLPITLRMFKLGQMQIKQEWLCWS